MHITDILWIILVIYGAFFFVSSFLTSLVKGILLLIDYFRRK